tara:strand:- start:668 stop:1051 length:384 start_codon:yes stop_codon:yes gene_type:complete
MKKLELFIPANAGELSEIEGKATIFAPRDSSGMIMAYFGRGVYDDEHCEFIRQQDIQGPTDCMVSIPIREVNLEFTSRGISGDGYVGRSLNPQDDGYNQRLETLQDAGLWENPEYELAGSEFVKVIQ